MGPGVVYTLVCVKRRRQGTREFQNGAVERRKMRTWEQQPRGMVHRNRQKKCVWYGRMCQKKGSMLGADEKPSCGSKSDRRSANGN